MPDMTGIVVRVDARGRKRYRASAWDNDAQRSVYKTFPTATAARNWRRDMETKIRTGQHRAAEPVTVAELWERWSHDAEGEIVRNRSGAAYKPSVIHSYGQTYNARLRATFGHVKVADVRRARVQSFVDKLVAEGLSPQTVKNVVNTLRVLLRYAIRLELIALNPCDGVELPSGGATRDRIPSPSEALDLVQALALPQDRAIMATAFFAGLRRGELMALRTNCVDLEDRAITVHKRYGNYDPRSRTFGPPKSKKGARTLGIPELLVPYLQPMVPEVPMAETVYADGEEHVVGPLLFTATRGGPFNDSAIAKRARLQWDALMLEPIGLHEARHAYASVMIAAGVNIKTISEWMGHSSVTITLDRYGHLLPGQAAVALGLLNNFLTAELEAS